MNLNWLSMLSPKLTLNTVKQQDMVPNSLLQNLDPESAKSCGRNAIDNLLM